METTVDFFGPEGPNFNAQISKVSFFYTTTALTQGVGMLFWMPLIVKYGRRPIYVISFILYFATGIWSGFAKTYGVELAGRIIMGFAAGAGECLGPLTIADLFFLHERGTVMATYTAALSMGVSGGIIIDGLITISLHWRYIYYVACALIGGVTLLVILTFPETTFQRNIEQPHEYSVTTSVQGKSGSNNMAISGHNENGITHSVPEKISYIGSLRLFNKTNFTSESLIRVFLRPIVLIILPSVLWTSLVFAVTIGFLVAISSNFATAFSTTYGFGSWQSGLCFISGLLGSFIGVLFGGNLSDWCADWFTKRNGGIREPEMRLPSIVIGGVCAPVALILYGVGINNQLHWMVPTLGLGVLNFAIVQATNVAMVYVIDCYRPAVGEVTVSILSFKGQIFFYYPFGKILGCVYFNFTNNADLRFFSIAAFGFLLSFYTNPWIDLEGYSRAFGEMACISGAIIALSAVFYYWGKPIRHSTWKWGVMQKYGRWAADREVGE